MDVSGVIKTRARLQRLSDAKQLTGWVTSLNNNDLVIRCNQPDELRRGDVLVIQATMQKRTAMFKASVVQVQGKNIFLSLVEAPKYFNSPEELRVFVSGMFVQINANGFELDGQVVDVSLQGIGLITRLPLTRGGIVDIHLESSVATVDLKAEVRYCRTKVDEEDNCRVGLRILEMDRINQARWTRIVDSASEMAA